MYGSQSISKLKGVFTAGGTLKCRTMHGGAWIFALQATLRILGLIRIVVLARLLAPKDFGLFGIAILTMALVETFSQTGFQPALIQKKTNVHPYLDSAWTVEVLRGILLSVVFFVITPYVVAFFNVHDATLLLRVIGLAILLKGMNNVGVLFFQKELEFHKQFVYEISPAAVEFVVTVTLAYLLRDVWALVYGLLAGSMLRLFFSYVLHPYRPKLSLNIKKAKELYHFGKWIFLFSILIFLINQCDNILVGKFLGATDLGYYRMAFSIAILPATLITSVVSQVTFPVYSKLQDQPDRFKSAFLKVFEITSLIIFPLSMGLFIFSQDIILVFLGPQWIPITHLLKVLSLKGLIWALAAVTGSSIYMSVGRPDINVKINLAQALILVILLYPLLSKWGALGIAIGVVIAIAINYVINIMYSLSITGVSSRQYFDVIWNPILGSLLAGGAGLLVNSIMSQMGQIAFFMSVTFMACTYILWLKGTGKIFLLREWVK